MGIFSAKNGVKAAQYSLATLGAGQAAATGALQTGAMQGTAAIQGGAAKAQGALDAAKPLSLAALGSGYDAAHGELSKVPGLFQPYADAGGKALGTYEDALGLNGAAGKTRATAAFHAGPQYDWLQSEAADRTARGANAAGMLMSGNTLTALQDRAGHIADGAWNGWADRLNGLVGTGMQANGAIADGYRSLADLDWRHGQAVAGVETGYGTASADLAYKEGVGEAGLYEGLGNNLANVSTNFAKSTAEAGAEGFKAKDKAAVNKANFILGVGSSLASLGGMAYGAQPKKAGATG